MEAIPLSREDQAILALEEGPVAGHTCKVIVVEPPAIEIDELKAAVAARVAAAPELTRKLGLAESEPCWVPAEDFDVGRRVRLVPVERPLASDALRREVARLFGERLDRDRPLWRIDVIPLERGRTALVWRIHHALADGTAAMRFARAILWDTAPANEARRRAQADDERRRGHLLRMFEHELGFVERELVGESLVRSPFDAEIGPRREIAFADVELEPLHRAAKELAGATVNDALLTIVAGGIRRWLEHHHGPVGSIRVRVPVSLHHEGDDAANRDSFFSLAVPLDDRDAASRLRAVRKATAQRKRADDARAMDALLRELARASPRLERFCERIEASPRRFALSVSNVRGPSGDVSVAGRRVERIHSVAEIGRRHALRVVSLSFAGRLWFGFCADPDVVEGLGEMATGLEAEAAELIASA